MRERLWFVVARRATNARQARTTRNRPRGEVGYGKNRNAGEERNMASARCIKVTRVVEQKKRHGNVSRAFHNTRVEIRSVLTERKSSTQAR